MPVLGLAQTQADGRWRRAFGAIFRAAAGTEHRHQRFIRLATHCAVRLNQPQAGITLFALVALGACFAFVTLGARVAFVTLGACLALVPLLTLFALAAGCALRPLRTLCARLPL